jgi:hypothetical protein
MGSMNARERTAALLSTLASAPLVGVLMLLIVSDAQAGEADSKLIATTGDTNLRKARGTDSEILALIPKGTTVEVGDCRNGWCRVSWNRQDGYAIARNLGTAAALRLPRIPVAVSPAYDRGPWEKVRKFDHAGAHEERDADHDLILEIGTAGEWPLNGERSNLGGTMAVEVTPIENWLELEFGFSTLATAGHTELSYDLLFKKPFRLSPTVEFMVGAGPSLSQTLNGPDRGTSLSAEFALDFMFWPTKDVGWYIEPTWSVNPRNGQQSAAVSIGMLIGFSKP